MKKRRDRVRAEWASFGIACGIVGVLVVGIAVLWVTDDGDALVSAKIASAQTMPSGEVRLTVEVTNRGDRTASALQVIVEVLADGATTEVGQQSIEFLSGGDSEELVFLVPAGLTGERRVRAASYAAP